MSLLRKERESHKTEKYNVPTPQEGVKRFLFILSNHFWRLVGLNLLFVLFSLPLVTIPGAFCAMNRVLINLVREGNCFLWSDFIKEFKACLFRSLIFALLFIIMIIDISYVYTLINSSESNLFVLLVAVCLPLVMTVFLSYVFVFLPCLDLKNRDIAKNAFILMMTELKTNLVIITGTLVGMLLLNLSASIQIVVESNQGELGISLLTFLLLLVIYFSFSQLIICTAINIPMQKRIIEPWENSR